MTAVETGPRPRYTPPPPRNGWQSLPVTLRYGLPLLLVAGLVALLVRYREATTATVQLVDGDDRPVTAATLEFFPYDRSTSSLAPPQKQGEATLEGGELTVGPDLVPQQAQVRIRAEGHGVSYAFMTLGDHQTSRTLGEPASIHYRVQDEKGNGLEGARVIALGGDQRGIPLAEAATDAEGLFTIEGIDSELGMLTLRVLCPGYARLDEIWAQSDSSRPVLRLEATEPVRGRVRLPDGVDPEGLHVIVRSFPGVSATLGPDGSFVLDHVPPPPKSLRLLVHGLPDGWTHRETVASPGDEDVVLEVARSTSVSGWVRSAENGEPISGAEIYHSHGPEGFVIDFTGKDGGFELGAVPPGEVAVRASWQTMLLTGEKQRLTGERVLEITEGEPLRGIAVRVR